MNLKKIESRSEFSDQIKLKAIQENFNELIDELSQKEIPDLLVYQINKEVDRINASPLLNIDRFIKSKRTTLLSLITKEAKIVPQNYYQNRWAMFGIAVFGIPIGALLRFLFDNIVLDNLGIPIGMILGFAFGAILDKKAKKEGRQLLWKAI